VNYNNDREQYDGFPESIKSFPNLFYDDHKFKIIRGHTPRIHLIGDSPDKSQTHFRNPRFDRWFSIAIDMG